MIDIITEMSGIPSWALKYRPPRVNLVELYNVNFLRFSSPLEEVHVNKGEPIVTVTNAYLYCQS